MENNYYSFNNDIIEEFSLVPPSISNIEKMTNQSDQTPTYNHLIADPNNSIYLGHKYFNITENFVGGDVRPASNAAEPASNAARPASNAAEPVSNAARSASNAVRTVENEPSLGVKSEINKEIEEKIKDIVNEIKITFILNNYFTNKFEIKNYKIRKSKVGIFYIINLITDKGDQEIQVKETPEKITLESPLEITLTSGFAIIAYIVFFIIFILILSKK